VSIVDVMAGEGRGPVWGDATDDLNLTLLAWPAGEGPPEHVNTERDVVFVVLEGSGHAMLDGVEHPVSAGHALVIPRGSRRGLTAGDEGIRYLSVHLRRGGLQITPRTP
jgi:quercetin dioxygenase-like cupin family protein